MGLRLIDLQVLERIRLNLPKGARALSLGYPDVLLDEADLRTLFDLGDAPLVMREDGAEIAKWHGRKLDGVVESVSLFKALGMDLDVWDIHASRGFEKIVDLNRELPVEEPPCTYDLVIDCGTVEHCFNIGQAMQNVALVVKEGGFVIHDNPVNMVNHGFYNVSPTFYHDWYEANGFVLTLLALTDGENYMPAKATARYGELHERMSNLVAARKLQHKGADALVWPMQSKYRVNPDLKAA